MIVATSQHTHCQIPQVAALVGATASQERPAACAPSAAPMARPFSMPEAGEDSTGAKPWPWGELLDGFGKIPI